MATCRRCNGPVTATAAVCPHCEAYLLEWDPVSGRLGPRADAPTGPSPASAPRPAFGLARSARIISNHLSLTVLRWLCGSGMALHGLLVLVQVVEPTLTLLGWIALWLPLDAFWRSTREHAYSRG